MERNLLTPGYANGGSTGWCNGWRCGCNKEIPLAAATDTIWALDILDIVCNAFSLSVKSFEFFYRYKYSYYCGDIIFTYFMQQIFVFTLVYLMQINHNKKF